MKFIIVSLLLSLIVLGVSAAACTQDSQCSGNQKCCFGGASSTGTCYDPSQTVCTTCYCSGCAALPSQLCSISNYTAQAQCCVDKCVDPAKDLCCAYHSPHSVSASYSTCANNGDNACCGSTCRSKSTQQCCIYQTGDVQYYPAPNDVVCCGLYGYCSSTQTCSQPGPRGVCQDTATQQPESCSNDTVCKNGFKCCNAGYGVGKCYDPTVTKCAECSCSGCAALPPMQCDIASFGSNAGCCVNKCYNPANDQCCSYHTPHSASGAGQTCELGSGTSTCCGQYCINSTSQQCCTFQSADPQNYPAPKEATCCGDYSYCSTGQTCSEAGPFGQCQTTGGGCSGSQCSDGKCYDQACCNSRANPNAQTGEGYLQYDAACRSGGQHCVGDSGCKLCYRGTGASPTGRPTCNF